jgi:glucose-1-phosphate thymidylyltransferase
MKGIVLAGGLGTRLYPLTKITTSIFCRFTTNDDLLSDSNSGRCGIKDIMIVTGGINAGDFLKLLGNGAEFGLKHLNYTIKRAREESRRQSDMRIFVGADKVIIILGDNILEHNIRDAVNRFETDGQAG